MTPILPFSSNSADAALIKLVVEYTENIIAISEENNVSEFDLLTYNLFSSFLDAYEKRDVNREMLEEALDSSMQFLMSKRFYCSGGGIPSSLIGDIFNKRGAKEEIKISFGCVYIFFPYEKESDVMKKVLSGKYEKPDGLFHCKRRADFNTDLYYIEPKDTAQGDHFFKDLKKGKKINPIGFCQYSENEFCPLHEIDEMKHVNLADFTEFLRRKIDLPDSIIKQLDELRRETDKDLIRISSFLLGREDKENQKKFPPYIR